jgi:hypothetical protein
MTKFATGLKLALSGAATLAVFSNFATPAQAAIEYPWCVQFGSGMGGGSARNCGFVSYEQCMMTARGAGGSCEQNLFYLDQVAKSQHPPRKRATQN